MKSNSKNNLNINNQITAKEVRLIDEEGQMLGVKSLAEALKLAADANLDLVEVSPAANPPVCKISNFGKMKYEMQKKAAGAKKKQKVVELKEVKFSINIGKGDYDFKVKHIIQFIGKGNKVKVSIRLKGREMAHQELATKMMEDITKSVEEIAKFESDPRMEGRQMVGTLVKNK